MNPKMFSGGKNLPFTINLIPILNVKEVVFLGVTSYTSNLSNIPHVNNALNRVITIQSINPLHKRSTCSVIDQFSLKRGT